MRLPVLPPSILLSILACTTHIRCMISLDFSAYPTSTQSCLEDAAGISGCTGDTVTEVNQCLCDNTGNFVINTATCIGSQGSEILEDVWDLLQSSCSNTKTPLDISEAKFLASGTVTKVTSTITTTSAGTLMTFTTISTNTRSSVASTATSASSTSSSSATSDNDDIVASARIGAIAASVAGTLFVVCVVCLVILLRKRKQDKELLRQAQEAARYGDRHRGPDKPLLNPGDATPGLSGFGGPGHDRTLGANVVPPTPSYAGPISPQVWRSYSQPRDHGTTPTPSELDSDSRSVGQHEDQHTQGHHGLWPSPLLSAGGGTMGAWCPSPLSAAPSSNVLGMCDGGNNTLAAASTFSSPLSRQITGTMSSSRSSWAHNRPADEIYELPGSEIMSPVEADSIPVLRTSERSSMGIRQAPPEYSAGGWNDPITDKPPTWI